MNRRMLALTLAAGATVLSACSFSVGSDPEEEAQATSAKTLTSACRAFTLSGGTSATVAVEAMRDALAFGEWTPESFEPLFTEVKAGVVEAAKTEGLSEADFERFRAFSEQVDRAKFAMTAPDGYPTRKQVDSYEQALGDVNELCGFTEDSAPTAE